MGIGNTTFYDVIKQLVEVGFIDIGHQGGANDKDCSIYAVSERWRDYGTENFKKVEKKRSLPSGMDVRSHMSRKKLLQETVVDSYRKP